MSKRIFDVFGASILLLVTLPLWPCIALVLWLDSGPVFFTQMRPGLRGREFRLIKFSTMRPGSELVIKIAGPGDSRVTRTGRFFRRYHLDELPQLINVIRGEMSLIGPRPIPLEYIEERLRGSEDYRCRLSVLPGLTGLVQIRGRRWLLHKGFRSTFRLDAFYVRHHCFILDLRILLATIPVILKGQGI